MAVQVTLSDLTNKVNEGWKKQQLAQHYGLPVAQMTKLLRDAGLQIRKFHNPKYVLVDDTAETTTENVAEVAPESVTTDMEHTEVVAEERVEDIVPDNAPDENESAQW